MRSSIKGIRTTSGGGFPGSHLSKKTVNKGNDTIYLDNLFNRILKISC